MQPNIYQCDYCKLIFKLKSFLIQHISKDHIRKLTKGENLICDYCKTVFRRKESLIAHIEHKHNELYTLEKEVKISKSHVKKNQLSCDTCGLNFDAVEILRMHIKTDHTFEDFLKFCKKSLQREEKLINKLFHCGFCETRFLTYDEMEKHARRYHDVTHGEFPCNLCREKFHSNSSLSYHKKVCTGNAKPHSCRHCPKLFTELTSLEFHVRIFHPNTMTGDPSVSSSKDNELPPSASAVYKCDHCTKAYYSDRSLRHHVRLKHTNGEVICTICSKVCNNKFYLKIHMKIAHTHKSLFQCEICDKVFSSVRNLRRHKDYTHKKVSRHKCIDCVSLFKESRSLRKHIRRKHPNSTTYPSCTVCEKRFESAKACKLHLRLTHSITVNTHPCHLCAASLSSYSSLKHHVRTKHFLDGKIFKCDKCNLTFFGDGFEKHTKTCTTISSTKSPHLCVICVKYFSSKKSLFRHLKLFHKDFDHIALAVYGSKGQKIPDGCDACKKVINSDFFNKKCNDANRDASHNIIVFICESCHTRYSSLEMSIIKHRFEKAIKFNISEYCTAEMSVYNGIEYDEPESTTDDFDIKTETDDFQLPSSSKIKTERDDDYADVKTELKLEGPITLGTTVVKSEPMTP